MLHGKIVDCKRAEPKVEHVVAAGALGQNVSILSTASPATHPGGPLQGGMPGGSHWPRSGSGYAHVPQPRHVAPGGGGPVTDLYYSPGLGAASGGTATVTAGLPSGLGGSLGQYGKGGGEAYDGYGLGEPSSAYGGSGESDVGKRFPFGMASLGITHSSLPHHLAHTATGAEAYTYNDADFEPAAYEQ